MRHNRAPKPGSRYYLPKATYHFVVQFCLSYNEMKSRINTLTVQLSEETVMGVSAYTMDGLPHGTGTSDPTAQEATSLLETRERLERELDRLKHKTALIEHMTLQEVGKEMYPFVLEGITSEGATMARLQAKGMPVTQHVYADMRRKVYYAISKVL